MNRRTFLKQAGLAWMVCAGIRPAVAEPRKKTNVLVILADDLSHEAVHALGNSEVQTPNLDRLAARGTVFTHAYNMGGWHGAVCVASRTMLMTGAYLWRAQKLEGRLKKECEGGRLWPQRMAAAGYETFMAGKWHVSAPVEQAFQQTAHVRGGMPKDTPAGYDRPRDDQEDTWKPWDTANGGYWEGGRHWSEVTADDGIHFLEEAREGEKPFFMYLAFNAPHDPRQAPKEYQDLYPPEKVAVPADFRPEYPDKEAIGCGPGLRDEKLAPFPRTERAVKVQRGEYYAIITHLDAQIGRVLHALEASGRAENTVVFFASDNGLACGHHGLFGKQNMHEHSMRVPLIAAGPGFGAGIRIDTPVYMQDMMATALELAGISPDPAVEFHSLPPHAGGGGTPGRDSIYGAYMNLQRMVVADGFKLVYYPKTDGVLLYDLGADPLETKNLADDPAHGDTLEKLKKRLAALQREMDDPLEPRW